MRDYAERIEKKDALQAHPEYLNEKINDHDKAIYAKGWNDCNKEYYNAITELPVASIACTDLSMRLRRTFEADELVNQRILLDAADAIEELVAELVALRNQLPHWISVEERMPHYLDHVLCVNKFGIQMVGYLTDYKEGGFRCESGMDSCDYTLPIGCRSPNRRRGWSE